MGLGARFGMWGGAELEAERQPPTGAHLFPAPPLPRAASASLEKPAAQETTGGAQTAAPAPPPRPPNPPEGAVAARVAPLPPTPPTPAGGTIYNPAPIPGLWAGAGCCAALIVAWISAPPRAGGDKFSLRKLGGTFSKTPRPREGETEPSALSLPRASHEAAQVPRLLEPSRQSGRCFEAAVGKGLRANDRRVLRGRRSESPENSQKSRYAPKAGKESGVESHSRA